MAKRSDGEPTRGDGAATKASPARGRGLRREATVLLPVSLLLFATLIPIYFISRWRHDLYDIPIWGSIPLWVCLLLIGRELAMTWFRHWAKHRGVVIPAAGAGKLKTAIQNVFIGAVILWFAFRDARKPMGWEHSAWADYWNEFHGGFVAVALAVATLLTVYSFVLYLYRNRALFSDRAR